VKFCIPTRTKDSRAQFPDVEAEEIFLKKRQRRERGIIKKVMKNGEENETGSV
jgi:hypothetical protein